MTSAAWHRTNRFQRGKRLNTNTADRLDDSRVLVLNNINLAFFAIRTRRSSCFLEGKPGGRIGAPDASMASILRQIVAGPRLPHPEAGLDLCYVTDNIIATSGPSSNYPKRAYRTPLKDLVNFLDSKHGSDWCIWEFRAEGTGYPDSEVYGRIHHFPFPDHHPPPFALIPDLMASMRNWIHRLDEPQTNTGSDNDTEGGDNDTQIPQQQSEGDEGKKQKRPRVAVVHCKAGKGRSGTATCSYLISQEGWKMEDALQRFTERRMRVGFGSGVSIPSQLRWVRYVDQWTNQLDKKYVERPVEILELHIWGLRDGVKVAVEGFVDQGRKIKCFHLFDRDERIVMRTETDASISNGNGNGYDYTKTNDSSPLSPETALSPSSWTNTTQRSATTESAEFPTPLTSAVLLRPKTPIVLPSADVNIDFERKSKAAYTGLAMVTSIAHIWFNPYFEGGDKYDSGVFEADWEALDGIKGTTRKGMKALDKLKVVWRYQTPQKEGQPGSVPSGIITEPKPGEPIHESTPADWRLQTQDQAVEEDEDLPRKDQENIPSQSNGGVFAKVKDLAGLGSPDSTPTEESGLQQRENKEL